MATDEDVGFSARSQFSIRFERPVGATPTRVREWDASYLGTTLMTGRPIEPGLAERLHLVLGSLSGLRAAADRLDDRVLLVRLLSASGPAFHEARRWIADRGARL